MIGVFTGADNMKFGPLFFVGWVVAVCGTHNVQGQVSLDEAVQMALKCHPQLQAARADVAIAQARLIDAGKLENPVFGFALQSQVADGPDREGAISLAYSQKFPVTGKLLLQRDYGVMDIKLACAEIREVERQFIGEVQKHYIDAVGALAQVRVVELLERDADKYIELANAQLKRAQGSELDVSAAETEKLLVSQSRELLLCDYREALAELRPLLGMPENEPLKLSDSLSSVTRQLRSTVRLSVPESLERSDVVAARVRHQRARVGEKLAQSESVEDWEIEAGYDAERSIDEPVGAERERFVGLGVKIPLPIRKKGQGMIAEARAEAMKAELELAAVEVKSRAEVASRIEALCRSEKTMATLEDRVLPQLRTRERQTREAYEQGLANFNQVVLLQQQQSRTSETLIQAQRDQAHELAKLQLALGTHPQLKAYDPCECPTYCPGTEPKNAPFALPVLNSGIRAMPVEAEATPVKTTRKKPLKNFFHQLSKGKGE